MRRAARRATVFASLLLAGVVGVWGARGCRRQGPATTSTATSTSTTTNTTDADTTDPKGSLAAALLAKGPGYVPHAKHKNADGTPTYTNRLILEASPYLLQHAHNPVDWFAWGEEAFARARALGRPVFLSIGYSTCHWCHVMEDESFEDEEVARFLNEHYVAIKVDREERPDLDAVYMTFVQSLTGSGGWPMTVWLTPQKEPFFGGTYFPPRSGVGGRRGLLEVLADQSQRFAADPNGIAEGARRLLDRLRVAVAPPLPGDFPSARVLRAARTEAASSFDPAWGGARGAPKFPSSFPIELLLRIGRRERDLEATRMAVDTLLHMAEGGIHDQVGGGFHRYSTDGRWLVPHFEEMLYDNALLASAYLEGWQATGDARLADTARRILDYLLREMRAADGTFFSATDADSPTASGERREGVFFTWTPAELRAALGEDDGRLAARWFGVTETGNVDGRSVLAAGRPLADVAQELGEATEVVRVRLADLSARLLVARARRPPPFRDEKVVVAWNALAISAFARAAIAFAEPRYAEAATSAASAWTVGLRAGAPLPHQRVDGKPYGRGFSDDHVFLAAALVDVFELTGDPKLLADAQALMETVEASFADGANGGYFLQDDAHEKLLLREKPAYDGPVPSVSSVAALTWLRLYTLTEDDRYRQRSETTLRAFARTLESRPLAMDHLLVALDWALDAPKEIVVVVPEGRGAMAPAARAFLAALGRTFAPNAALVVATEAELAGELGRRVPWAQGKRLRGGVATAYVCERGACKLPTNDAKVFATQVAEVRAYP